MSITFPKSPATKSLPVIYFLFATMVFVYLLVRAIFVPVVHDEAITFFRFINTGKFVPFYAGYDANNHFLNSFLSFGCFNLFGKSLFALRLPNLLAFILFAIYTKKITGFIRNNVLAFFLGITLLSADYLVEFFGMCRGYGLSMAFLLMAIYYVMLFTQNSGLKNFTMALLAGMLALSSNLALLSFFVVMLCILAYKATTFLYANKNKPRLLYIIVFLLVGVLPVLFWSMYALKLKKEGALLYGSTDGFIPVTLNSLLDLQTGTHHWGVVALVCIFFVLSGALSLFVFFKRGLSAMVVAGFLLSGTFFVVYIQSYVLGVNFPADRVGLYFIPLFFLAVVFLADALITYSRYWFVLFLPILIVPAGSLLGLNTTHFKQWPDESMVGDCYARVKAIEMQSNQQITVGGKFDMAWLFYGFDDENALQPIHSAEWVNHKNDINFLMRQEYPHFKKGYSIIDSAGYSDYLVVKRRKPRGKQLFCSEKLPDTLNCVNEFYLLYSVVDSALTGHELQLCFDGIIQCNKIPFSAGLVFFTTDENEKVIHYDAMPLEWIRNDWTNAQVRFTRNIPALKNKKDKLYLHIVNLQKCAFSLRNLSIKVYKLK